MVHGTTEAEEEEVTPVITVIFFLSIFFLYYIYDGYLRVLKALCLFRLAAARCETVQGSIPTVTVVVTVYNEAGEIRERLNNIFATDYPHELIEVLVASDGSTDSTDDIVKSYEDKRVKLYKPMNRSGKTETQNQAIAMVTSDIVVFTDAGTRFDRGFLKNIAHPFSDPLVGGVDGHLLFIKASDSSVSTSQGYYWSYELKLREHESLLGYLAVSSGGCLAVRRRLLKHMPPTTGEDCIVPLDVILQGYKMVHATDAIAHDRMDNKGSYEFKTRVRMTLRNWQGTWSRSRLLNPLLHPAYAFSLWSHKLMRWLSPVFIMIATFSAVTLAANGQTFFIAVSRGFALFYFLGILGWITESKGVKLPLAGAIYSFILANFGFLFGLIKAFKGQKISAYRQ